jgi:hypothetical protein
MPPGPSKQGSARYIGLGATYLTCPYFSFEILVDPFSLATTSEVRIRRKFQLQHSRRLRCSKYSGFF